MVNQAFLLIITFFYKIFITIAPARIASPITAKTKSSSSAFCKVRVLFKDVQNTKQGCYTPVYWANDQGIVMGFNDGTFRVDDSCTRGQVVMFLWRTAGSPEPKNTKVKFSDVPASHLYYKAILWASQKGIAAGFNNGTFKPNDPCTRGQIVTFLWRYSGKKTPKAGAKGFSDVSTKHVYYKSIMWACGDGIAAGFGNGTFRPDATCTRGQCVTFLYRMLKV